MVSIAVFLNKVTRRFKQDRYDVRLRTHVRTIVDVASYQVERERQRQRLR